MDICEGLSRMSWKLSRTVLRGGVTGNGDALLGKGEKGNKQPYYITPATGMPFTFAGLWERWIDKKVPDKAPLDSFAIVTTAASLCIQHIHSRMPVILAPRFHSAWLDPKLEDPNELNRILQTGAIQEMEYFPVSKAVNSVRNNGPDLIKKNIV
jgi:putative SOS response-associated peptidase YedK